MKNKDNKDQIFLETLSLESVIDSFHISCRIYFFTNLDILGSDFRSGDFCLLGGDGSRTALRTGEKDLFGMEIPLEPSGHTQPPFTLMSTNFFLLIKVSC